MQFLGQRLHDLTQRTVDSTVDNVRDLVLRALALVLIGTVVLWVSVFIYVAFYYAYMPAVSHSRPVHLQFQACEPDAGVCSFPSAHVQLTKRNQLLKFGQQYRVYLHLEMPESPRNKELGMFMVCIHVRDKGGALLTHSCRTAMLHYRSELLLTLKTLVFTPLLLIGPGEEKQGVSVELFADYEEDSVRPATDVYIEVQSRHVEIYSAWLNIHAHFTGLRHLMFHWPVLSAAVGITSNMFFLGVICVLSWCHLSRSREGEEEHADDQGYHFSGDTEEEAYEERDYEDIKDPSMSPEEEKHAEKPADLNEPEKVEDLQDVSRFSENEM